MNVPHICESPPFFGTCDCKRNTDHRPVIRDSDTVGRDGTGPDYFGSERWGLLLRLGNSESRMFSDDAACRVWGDENVGFSAEERGKDITS